MGEKIRTDSDGKAAQGWDHDPPAQRKWTPIGILMLASGMLALFFGQPGTSDLWADSLRCWWEQTRSGLGHIRRLVIYLDNGPDNSGRRTQWLKRMVEFADWSGLEIHLVYYPPYHSKYNPVERCWSALEQKWGGELLTDLETILSNAGRMVWQDRSPEVTYLDGPYETGRRLTRKEMKPISARLERSQTLPKYDIIIKPLHPIGG